MTDALILAVFALGALGGFVVGAWWKFETGMRDLFASDAKLRADFEAMHEEVRAGIVKWQEEH